MRVVRLNGMHYDVPGGAVGRRYVDLLTEEVAHLAAGNFSADRLVVFSSVVLQRDKSVKKMADVRRVLERRMKMWVDNEFDLLLQEAERCDRSVSGIRKDRVADAQVVKVFTRLMLQGKVRAAVRWLSEKSRSNVLSPSDIVECKNGNGVQISVWELSSLSEASRAKDP